MDVVVAGGHGKIGLRLLRLLAQDGHRARASSASRSRSRTSRKSARRRSCSTSSRPTRAELAQAIDGADAVVFAAGAGPGSGEERKRTMDYGGAVKLIEAAKQVGASRYLMVSSMGADAPHAAGAEGTFLVYLQAKHDADNELVASGLDYTIVRPHLLTDDPAPGRCRSATRWSAARCRATTSPPSCARCSMPATPSARRSS